MGATPKTDGSRRKFLQGVLAVGVGAAVERSLDDSLAASPSAEEMPEIKLGELAVSRLCVGLTTYEDVWRGCTRFRGADKSHLEDIAFSRIQYDKRMVAEPPMASASAA